jgi:hypothetical protein
MFLLEKQISLKSCPINAIFRGSEWHVCETAKDMTFSWLMFSRSDLRSNLSKYWLCTMYRSCMFSVNKTVLQNTIFTFFRTVTLKLILRNVQRPKYSV